jgi:hypothetical protein
MKFLDKEWSKQHLDDIVKKADKRYTPKLNVELPISEIFDGLCRTEAFYIKIQTRYGKLLKKHKSLTKTFDNKNIQKTYDSFTRIIFELLNVLKRVDTYTIDKIDWEKIHKLSNKARSISWQLDEQLRKEKEKPSSKEPLNPKEPYTYPKAKSDIYNSDLHDISEIQIELNFFIKFSSETSAKTSNKPFLMINGLAGSGKTHLLCDLAKYRFEKNYAPTVLCFGEFFEGSDDVWQKISRQLKLAPTEWTKNKILKELDVRGKKAKCRSILMIDALNESRPLSFWNKKLSSLVRDVSKFPNIALVITIRSGYESDVISKKADTLFIHEEHRGFEFQEWEAVTKFFTEYSLPLPEIPLLTPEFQNPLFLLLFCKAFENSTDKKKVRSFRGHEGATHIFEKYVDSVSKKIEKKFNIDHGTGKNIWDTVIEKIAESMVINNVDRLFEDEILNLIKNAHPTVDAGHLLSECDKSFLLVKVPHYVSGKGASEGFDYKFPFQRFSDHLIGRYLFKNYENEFGKANKNITTAKKYFSKRRKLGKFLDRGVNRGVIEALFIQCPEQLNGVEFFEVAPYVRDYLAKDAFVQSIIWRKPSAFTSDLKHTLDFINKHVILYSNGDSEILNAFLTVSVVPKHPFNAEFLHSHLMKKNMPVRDARWSVFLHDEHGNRDAVDRILKWSWSSQDISHLSDESIFLTLTTLTWFLTTPNRFVRDKATKGLTNILQNRLHLVVSLLEKFKDIDDPYVTERLLAASYGAVLRNRDDFKNLQAIAIYVYKRFFSHNRPPVHVLIRDYARGLVEVAKINQIKFHFSDKKLQPPYISDWPKRVPSGETLKKKYYPDDYFADKTKDRGFLDIWSSVNYNMGSLGDFGNYEVNSHLGAWSGRKLNRPEPNRKELYESFKKSLTKKQNNLLGKATNPFFGIDFSKLVSNIKFADFSEVPEPNQKEERKKKRDEKREQKSLLVKFKESLTENKRQYFEREIQPFLSDNGNMNDPYDRFDTSLAQRWIFNRVVKLGFDPKLHGDFDNRVNRYDRSGRSNHKAERIGKKYQWIALHEFTALVADHFEFSGKYWSDDKNKYLGAWNPYMRDIDPSMLLQDDSKIKSEATFEQWRNCQGSYDGWQHEKSDTAWLKKPNDLIDPKNIINITDDSGKQWLSLKGVFVWQQDIPPHQEKYDRPSRELFYILKSFIVKKKDLNEIVSWINRKGHGNWLPESHDWYETFIGEFPNSLSFEDMRGNHNIWTKASEDKNIPLVVTDDSYLNEFTLDCSRDENISMMLPSKFLVERMKLKHPELDGRFRDKYGNLVIYATSVSEENNPPALLADKKSMVEFLDKQGYAIFWTILGEKQFIGGGLSGLDKYKGRLDIVGTYYLDSMHRLKGGIKSKFDTPKKPPRGMKK